MLNVGPRRFVRSAALVAMFGGCGHALKVTNTTIVAACDGAAVTAVGRPTWATVADYDRDGDADLLLLDVHIDEPAGGAWASVVPLRATPAGLCRDPAIPVWTEPRAAPRLIQVRADDIDSDGLADLTVWNSSTRDLAILRGTGDARTPFTQTADAAPADIDLARQEPRQRWEAADVDARGRLYVTTPELHVALERGQRPPRSGRRRHPVPFPVDYAVYLDLSLSDTSGFRTLVVGAGPRLAIRENRAAPRRWKVLRLQ